MSQADAPEPIRVSLYKHALERLIMLSDGVFAIAITLAAIEIRPPRGVSAEGLVAAMAPHLMIYGIAFAIIGALWLAHRSTTALLTHADGPASLLTLVFLGLVALQPAGVALLVENGPRGGALQLYFGLIVATGVAQGLLWGYVAFVGKLVRDDVPRAYRISRLVTSFALPVIATALSMWASQGGKLAMLGALVVMVAIAVTRNRLDRRMGV